MFDKPCSLAQAQTIGKIFTPYSINFYNWAKENLTSRLASPIVEKLINKTLNPNHSNFEKVKALYDECRKELEFLGYTEEMRDKYSPFNV